MSAIVVPSSGWSCRLRTRRPRAFPRRHCVRRRPRIAALKATLVERQSEIRPLAMESNCVEIRRVKPRVAVDVDEVLGQFLVALNGFCREHYGMSHNVEDYHVYHFATVWGCSQEMSTEIVHEFFESSYFQQLPLVPGAFEALCEMQAWCDLHVVTSRQHVIQDITIHWLSTHYPGIFTSVQFGNHFAQQGASKKKSELCKEIAADVLIDDNPDYAIDCASSGMNVILYNWKKGYPWSKLAERDDRIREVFSWSDIPETLKSILLHQNNGLAQI